MSSAPIIPAPDWFDRLWEENKERLPLWARNDGIKKLARQMFESAIKTAAQQATTPQGVRALIAFARIQAMLGIASAPDPDPELVVEKVRALLERLGR